MKPLVFFDAQKPSSLYLTGTRVDEWVDANGSGRSVATTALGTGYNPTFNSSLFSGKGGITFNVKFLESPTAFPELNWNKGFTILIAGTVRNGFFGISDGANFLFGKGQGRALGVGTYAAAIASIPEEPCVFGIRWDGVRFDFILNGRLFPIHEGGLTPGSGPLGKIQIGGLMSSAGNSLDMDVSGITIFDNELDVDDIAEQCSFLDETPPSIQTHNIVVDGDSLAVGYFGYGTNSMWKGISDAGLKAIDVVNVANSGIQTPTLSTRFNDTVLPLLNKSVPSKRRILLVWEITNDLSNTSQTDTAAYANIKTYCQTATAAGFRVIALTCLPRTQAGINPNFETYRLSVNASITAHAVAEGWAVAVANVGGDATIGATGASDNTTYYQDKIHLTAAGHGIAAGYITTALGGIL